MGLIIVGNIVPTCIELGALLGLQVNEIAENANGDYTIDIEGDPEALTADHLAVLQEIFVGRTVEVV